jgi:putative methionine-R-sulfoxide reductase with GAF domain
MDQYPNFGNGFSTTPPAPNRLAGLAASQPLPPLLDDHRKSLEVLADRDLRATLQLLADRAQFLTAASGVIIALIENGKMICRASVGQALRIGTALQLEDGLTGQSLRLRELMRCDDAEKDPRVNRDGCRAFGIRSVMVAPLLRDGAALGIFELLADRAYAFEEQDESSLEWLSQCVVTALDHAASARSALEGAWITKPDPPSAAKKSGETPQPANSGSPLPVEANPAPVDPSPAADASPAPAKAKTVNSKQCTSCGFPVSPGRTLCIDCEAAQSENDPSAHSFAVPGFLASTPPRQQSWFDQHMYTIGTIAVAALTGLALYLKFH